MSYAPDRDVRNIHYNDPTSSDSHNWVDRNTTRVQAGHTERYQPSSVSSPQVQNHFRNTTQTRGNHRNDPDVAEQLRKRIEIAKLNCEFYETLIQLKSDCSIQAGMKVKTIEKLIEEHQKLILDSHNNTQRAERFINTVIRMLKQAQTNNGFVPQPVIAKAPLLEQAKSQLKFTSDIANLDSLNSKIKQHDQQIGLLCTKTNDSMSFYQQKIHTLETEFVKLQQEQKLAKLKNQANSSIPSTPQSRELEPIDFDDDIEPKDENDMWSVFEQEDQRRHQEIEEVLSEQRVAEEIEAAKPNSEKTGGVIFLTDEEGAAIDRAREEKAIKKVDNMNKLWEDLQTENELCETDEDEDIMESTKPKKGSQIVSKSGRGIELKSSGRTISVQFGKQKNTKKQPIKRDNSNSSNDEKAPSIKLKGIKFGVGSPFGNRRELPKALTTQGEHPFPSQEYEALRVVIHSADMKHSKMFQEPDPYCNVTLGSTKKKTAPLSKMSDDIWHTTFLFSDKEIKKSKSPELIVAFCHYKKHAVKLVTSADVICKGSVNLTTIPFSESAEPLELPLYSRSTNKKIGSAVITIQRFKTQLKVNPIVTPHRTFVIPKCSQIEFDNKFIEGLQQEEPDTMIIGGKADVLANELKIAADKFPKIDLDEVAKLIEIHSGSIPFDWSNSRGQTLLHLMILHQNSKLVQFLAPESNLFSRDYRGCTPLDAAVFIGNTEIVNILINSNFNIVNMCNDNTGHTPLMIASIFGYRDIVKLLIQNAALLDDQDKSGGTALMKAAYNGHYDIVVDLAQQNCIIGAEDKEGFCALLLALMNGHQKVASYLLDFGANFTVPSAEGDSPFFLALMADASDVVSAMLQFEIVLDEQSGRHKQSIFHRLMIFCDEETVMKYLELFRKVINTVDYTIKNRMGQPALFYAAHFNYIKVLKFLLDNGTDVFTTDRNQNKVLHFCSTGEAVDIVIQKMKDTASPMLLAQEINSPNNQGNTPMHIAYAFGDSGMIQSLIKHGGDLNAKNKYGNIPHHMKLADRRRLLPLYLVDEEAPKCGGVHIGEVFTIVDPLIVL